MKITDAFIQEHAEIMKQLDRLEVLLLGKIKTLKEVKEPGAKLAITLDEHGNLEEELLFDTLEAKLGNDENLREVRDDHTRIEKLMQEVLGTLEDIQRLGHARRNLLKAIKVARAHFSREESKTFPLAEEILGEETLLELGVELQKRRQK
jgi:hemerythrin-like domain-containing protein